MKIGRYVLVVLIVVIVALVIHGRTRQSPVKAPARPDSPESPAAQNSKVITNPFPRAKKPMATTESIAGNAAITTNPSFSNVGVPSEKSPSSNIESSAEIQASEAAAHPAAVQSSFSQGPPPPTPVAPPPLELFRTNSPEQRPGEGRTFSGP